MKREKIYYKYRAFNPLTVESLCNDTIHFADPASFNDPLDCSFTVICDSSSINEIRQLYSFLFKRRRNSETLLILRNAKITDKQVLDSAITWIETEAQEKLNDIAFSAADTESVNYCYHLTKEQAEKQILLSQIEEEIKILYTQGVACFSSSCTSPVLWSHYGDEHKGICIGYSTNRNPIPEMLGVEYGDYIPINMSTLINAFLENNEQLRSSLGQEILLRKAKKWKYENESRLIGKQGIQDSPLLLTDITFGLRCPDAVRHTILKALDGREQIVNYYQIQTSPNSYSLKREKFYTNEYGNYLPKTIKSVNEVFDSVTFDTEI